jgi:hypothetical protein
MLTLFKTYQSLLEERLNKIPLLHLGEDSIRYDFFAALMQVYQFRPSQIQLEVAIHSDCFIPIQDVRSKRKEKPLIDLIVNEPDLNIAVEFGLFRQNSNEAGSINKTARTVKMLNDMIRVALQKHFIATTALFICVADHKMLGHQLTSKILGKFPSDYVITNAVIEHQLQQKTNDFDHRFLNVFRPMEREIYCRLIYDHMIRRLSKDRSLSQNQKANCLFAESNPATSNLILNPQKTKLH